MGKMSYRPEIDGLRAVAVLMVVLFHAGFGFPGGYVGVDVFFVISGFLITGLVAKDLQADRFHFIEFWERRIRRIFPALASMVAVTLGVGTCVLLPQEFAELAESAIYQTLLVANFYFLDNTGYFQGAADLKPLLHTWSLAVEEQFYLFLPALLVLWKRVPARQLSLRLTVIALFSFGLSVWGSYAFAKATFYLLPMRAWELMIGSLLALAPMEWNCSRRTRNLLGTGGLAVILSTGFWYTSDTRFPGANALAPCLGAALLIFANTPDLTFTGRLLACRPAVFIGKLSYSLYLWHWPVLALLRNMYGESLPVELRIIAVLLSFVLAWMSWKFVETPLRKPTAMSRRRVFLLSCACSLLMIAVSMGILLGDGLRFRFSPRILHILDGSRIAEVEEQEINPIGVPLPPGVNGDFLLWGDSHARAVNVLIHELARKHHLSGYVASRSATVPALGTWRHSDHDSDEWNQRVVDFIKSHGIQHVIMASRWTINIDGRPNGSMNSLIIDAQTQTATRETAREVLQRGLKKTFDELNSAGVTVWLIRQVPQQAGDIPRLLAQQQMFHQNGEISRVSLAEHQAYQARVNAVLDEFQGDHVILLDPTPFCFDEYGQARVWDEQLPFYSDNHHLSEYGATQLLEPLLQPVIAEIEHQVQLAKSSGMHPVTQQAEQSDETVLR